jgi:type IV pilus assembly protein PilV
VRRQAGFTLIEVLIALLVLSIGLLGLAFLQGQGVKFNTDAYNRSQASLLAYDIMDRMRANRSAVGKDHYDASTQSKAAAAKARDCSGGASCNCYSSVCSITNLARFDLAEWYALQAATLPPDSSNLSTITRSGTEVTVVMRWKERDALRSQQWVFEP